MHTLGNSPEEILINSWSGKDFYSMDNVLTNITVGISDINFKERAYPLLQFYHSQNKYYALSYALPILDDALTFYEYGLQSRDYNINYFAIRQLRSAITLYLDSFDKGWKNLFEPSEVGLVNIDMSKLEERNIPVISQEDFNKILEELKGRRIRLLDITRENWTKFIKV